MKKVECQECGELNEVGRTKSLVECDNCGAETRVLAFSGGE